MIEELNRAADVYRQEWEAFVAARHDVTFFENLLPTAVAWKVADIEDFNSRFAALREYADQVHLGWVNDRWLATFHIHNESLVWGIQIVKLMQRRPNSTDATGLDHVDFLIPEDANAKNNLSQETGLRWTEESNGDWCKWLSIWFADTEAKLRSDTTFDVCAREMEVTSRHVTGR
jgi:hypothetical protein